MAKWVKTNFARSLFGDFYHQCSGSFFLKKASPWVFTYIPWGDMTPSHKSQSSRKEHLEEEVFPPQTLEVIDSYLIR